jgi:3-methyladenine DNA glycosylase Tag
MLSVLYHVRVLFFLGCHWLKNNPLARKGGGVQDDQKLFEFLILEEAEAGLSWRTYSEKGRKLPASL